MTPIVRKIGRLKRGSIRPRLSKNEGNVKKYALRPKQGLKRRFEAKKRKSKGGEKVWKLKKADKHFSLWIRDRDGRCLHPNCKRTSAMLQNSHFIGRATKSTRYDPDNCITLCWLCHYKDKMIGFEYQKQTKEKHGFDGQYTLFMKRHLGEERYAALVARSLMQVNQKNAILNYMKVAQHG